MIRRTALTLCLCFLGWGSALAGPLRSVSASASSPGPGPWRSGDEEALPEVALIQAADAVRAAAAAYDSADRHLLRRWLNPGPDIAASEAEFVSALRQAARSLDQVQEEWGIDPDLRTHVPVHAPRGSSAALSAEFEKAARRFEQAAEAWSRRASAASARSPSGASPVQDPAAAEAEEHLTKGLQALEGGLHQDAWVTDPLDVAGVLLGLLGLLFVLNQGPRTQRLFRVVPLLVFAYFLPTVLSNLHLIPIRSPLYVFIKTTLLPASLVLLVLAVDVPATLRLGRNALILFATATLSIVIGGPLALLCLKGLIPEGLQDQAWRGLAAVAGSWIGGGANFVAIGQSAGASPSTLGMMVVVDVVVAEIWMVALLFFAGREKEMDAKIGADRRSLDEVRHRIESFEKEVSRPVSLADMLVLLFLAFGATALARGLADHLPAVRIGQSELISGFTWVVLLVTTFSLVLSFTKVRRLEGAGASKLGSALLYLLVAAIGAGAEFSKVLQVPSLMLIGAVWMAFHAASMLLVRRWLKAPIFFAAVGSKANVGGAASAPILASAFHPALAPVGVLLAIVGYVLGTYMGLVCKALLEWAA